MQHLRQLSNWAYKIGWAILPNEAASDFRGILWTFMAWQWVRLKSICSGRAEEPVLPFRCHRNYILLEIWNLFPDSQKVLVLPSSSGGKSVVLNYNFKRKKKKHTFCSTSMVTFWFVFFFSQNSSFQEWTGKESKSDYWHDNSWMCQVASRSQAVSKYLCFRSRRPQSDAGADGL